MTLAVRGGLPGRVLAPLTSSRSRIGTQIKVKGRPLVTSLMCQAASAQASETFGDSVSAPFADLHLDPMSSTATETGTSTLSQSSLTPTLCVASEWTGHLTGVRESLGVDGTPDGCARESRAGHVDREGVGGSVSHGAPTPVRCFGDRRPSRGSTSGHLGPGVGGVLK